MSRPALRLGLLGLLAFAIALIVMWPARWLAPALPDDMHCADWSGSLWRGQCTGFQWQTGTAALGIETTQWRVHPLALLRGRLQADVELLQTPLQLQGRISSGLGGGVKVEHLNATGVLDRKLLAALPAGWSMHFELKDAGIEYRGGTLHELSGLAIARQLHDAQGNALGDYQLQFEPQPAAPFKGQLRDLAGPLQLAATVTINADRSWQLDGNASLRPGSPQSLARALDQLGGADLNGQRRISIAGTFD